VIDCINQAARRLPTWPLYILSLLPAPWLVYQGATGGLGVEPINAIERALGEWALWFLIAGLAITPLRRFAGLNLIRFRRMLGLVGFTYVSLHLLTWLVLDIGDVSRIWADIVKRPYITVGMLSLVLLLPLAITSNTWSIRKLGPKWRSLHKLTYAAVFLGGLHYIMLVKSLSLEPVLYMAAILALLAVRSRFSQVNRMIPG
jgi:sulfoxide reductase heme-binding subunit YedZ